MIVMKYLLAIIAFRVRYYMRLGMLSASDYGIRRLIWRCGGITHVYRH